MWHDLLKTNLFYAFVKQKLIYYYLNIILIILNWMRQEVFVVVEKTVPVNLIYLIILFHKVIWKLIF